MSKSTKKSEADETSPDEDDEERPKVRKYFSVGTLEDSPGERHTLITHLITPIYLTEIVLLFSTESI